MAYSKQNFQDGQILTAANLEKMENGIIAGQGVRNLLVNSDFRNPVNTNGQTSYTGAVEGIDRWVGGTSDSKVYINTAKSVAFYTNTVGNLAYFRQYINIPASHLYGKTFTLALEDASGTIFVGTGTYLTENPSSTKSIIWITMAADRTFVLYMKTDGNAFVQLSTKDNTTTIRWAALYEGSYTPDTLPNYIPNSPRQETIDVGLPIQPTNLLKNSDFLKPINTNGQTSYTGSGYSIDKWRAYHNSTTHEVTSSGIKVSGDMPNLYQPIDASIIDVNKIYTCAAKDSSGNIYIYSGLPSDTTGATPVCVYTSGSEILFRLAKSSTTWVWAAMYEGKYDITNLPPYVKREKTLEKVVSNLGIYPENLLFNTDFRNPININKVSTTTQYKICLDNWIARISGIQLTPSYSGLHIKSSASSNNFIYQRIATSDNLKGKTVTVAICDGIGRITTKTITFPSSYASAWTSFGNTPIIGNIYAGLIDIGDSANPFCVRVGLQEGSTEGVIKWVALYDGAYTTATLPPYMVKNKHVEMLNCNVPLTPHNLLDNSDFRNPVNQRGQSSYTANGYTIDRWYLYIPTDGSATLKINSGYISLTGGSSASSLSCRFSKGIIDANKTYTAVWCNTNGDINITSFIRYDSFDAFEISVGPGETKNIAWAALYEGSYDASTLPPYVPKGYAAELAECQRYYENSWFGTNKSSVNEYLATPWNSAQADARIEFKQHKRISPTITLYPESSDTQWKVYSQGNYYIAASANPVKRNGLSGFIVRITKGDSDASTWTPGSTIQARGHWEASADL